MKIFKPFLYLLLIILLTACASVRIQKMDLDQTKKYLFVSDLHPERATNKDMVKFLKTKEKE